MTSVLADSTFCEYCEIAKAVRQVPMWGLDGTPARHDQALRSEVFADLLGPTRRNSGGICVPRPLGDSGANRINE